MVLNQRGALFWGSNYCKNGVTLPGGGSNFEKEIIFQGGLKLLYLQSTLVTTKLPGQDISLC